MKNFEDESSMNSVPFLPGCKSALIDYNLLEDGWKLTDVTFFSQRDPAKRVLFSEWRHVCFIFQVEYNVVVGFLFMVKS